ncbi:MAG: ATP-binding protein [Synergistaceae bacterium]|nr:ATP-binding protein [Synergistaceae bacterium]
MLEDLSAHILDIAQNSIAARAKHIDVTVRRSAVPGFVDFCISDDGCGMDEARARAVLDPFCTSRTTRRVGMGLPFLKQNAELCGGEFHLTSAVGRGTTVFASFSLSNIDTPPIGDLAGTFLTLLIDAPQIYWIFRYASGAAEPFLLDSEELKEAVDGLEALKIPDVALGLKEMIENGIASVDGVE